MIVPLSGDGWNEFIDIPATAIQRKLVYFSAISANYFQTLDVPILAGRDFDNSDSVHSPPVALVNEAFAKEYLGGSRPIGKTFSVRQDPGKPNKVYRIIGLVTNTKYRTLKEPYVPIAFVAQNQNAQPDADLTVMIHSDQAMGSLISSLRSLAEKNNPQMVLNFSVLQRSVRETLPRERLMATLSGFYGALAAILSLVGLYGMMSYMTLRRTSELGIRMALGASRARILRMILRDGLSMLGLGVVLGTILVVVSGRAVQALLFGLNASDPISMLLAIVGMTLIACVACLVPARRAASLQPMQALREE
jgi:ABC-type antimicrobial peptide transport system permease subunit